MFYRKTVFFCAKDFGQLCKPGLYGIAVVSAFASQYDPDSNPSFRVDFSCSPCARVGLLQMLGLWNSYDSA